MEEDGPLPHREPGPLLERVHAGQEVHVLLAKLTYEFVATKRLNGPERGPADVLHLIVRDAQPLRDRAVGSVLACIWRWLCAPESEQQHRLAQLRLQFLGQLWKATSLLHHLSNYIIL